LRFNQDALILVPLLSSEGLGLKTYRQVSWLPGHSLLLQQPSHLKTVACARLSGYSGGTTQDLHLIPFYPVSRGTCSLSVFDCLKHYIRYSMAIAFVVRIFATG